MTSSVSSPLVSPLSIPHTDEIIALIWFQLLRFGEMWEKFQGSATDHKPVQSLLPSRVILNSCKTLCKDTSHTQLNLNVNVQYYDSCNITATLCWLYNWFYWLNYLIGLNYNLNKLDSCPLPKKLCFLTDICNTLGTSSGLIYVLHTLYMVLLKNKHIHPLR